MRDAACAARGYPAATVGCQRIGIQRPGWRGGSIRVTLAAPHRISACSLSIDLDLAVFGPPNEVDVFSATGDQAGSGHHSRKSYRSGLPLGNGGCRPPPGVPMLVIDAPVLASGAATTTVNFSVSPAFSQKPMWRRSRLSIHSAHNGGSFQGGRRTLD